MAHCAVSATVNNSTVDSTLISRVDWDWGDHTTSTTLTNLGNHPYDRALQFFLTAQVTFTTHAIAHGAGSVTIKP